MVIPLIRDRIFEDFFLFRGPLFLRLAPPPQLVTDGILSANLQIPLPLNAVVRQYDVVIQAKTASATIVQQVAQVRGNPATQTDIAEQGSVVVDFGTPRTVSEIQVPTGMTITSVKPWIGTGFASQAAFSVVAAAASTSAVLSSEILTERLLVQLTGTISVKNLAAQMKVVLPEAPSGLELRINGAAPVFTFTGAAEPGPKPDLTDDAWSSDGRRILHLADALAALTGDPTNSTPTPFNVVLSSKTPGVLSVALEPNSQLVSYVRRVAFGSDTSKNLVFPEEGFQEISLDSFPAQELPLDSTGARASLSTAAQVQQIHFTVLGNLPPERVLPPIGPENANLADLIVNPARATMVRLPAGTKLQELTAIRLPLLAGSGGAEARVVLWQSAKGDPPPVEPDSAIPQGASDPAQLSESQNESWVTFPFKRAVPLDASHTYWAALVASRGQITWPMASSTGTSDPITGIRIDDCELLSGAPAGPWLPLPSPFRGPASRNPLAHCRGRVRMAGHPAKDAPIAPMFAILGTAAPVPVTPTQKGTDQIVILKNQIPLHNAKLRLVSLVAGTATIQNLDVVSTL